MTRFNGPTLSGYGDAIMNLVGPRRTNGSRLNPDRIVRTARPTTLLGQPRPHSAIPPTNPFKFDTIVTFAGS
jgi:hypothetical protein